MFEKKFLSRTISALLNKPLRLPNYAQIEITNRCNLECPMCFKYFIKVQDKHMDLEVFKKITDKLKGVEKIVLCGYGEPLCHPGILEAIAYSKQNGFTVELTSNGLLLNSDERIKKIILSGLDSITVSLENVKKSDKVTHPNLGSLDNIRRLIGLRKEMGFRVPGVVLQTLMIKGKEEDLFDVINWGALNGVDRINVARFEQLNTLTEVERPNIKEEKTIFKEFSRLRRKYNVRIDCPQDQVYSGLKGLLYRHFKYFLNMDKHCIRLKDFVYVNVDGDIRPCCALVECKIDSLLNNDLVSIWRSKKYDNFRKNYHKVPWCSRCDFAKLKQLTGEEGPKP